MPKSLYDNSNITSNSKQLALLKQHFPNCFDKEGNFIAHKMEEIVGESGLELSKESYSLNWLGKSYARLLANENPRTLLKEDKEHNAIEQNAQSENLLIKGDNLEVLKHLSHAYAEQIKMIYIDPPYNTGGDGFVYNDDRKFTVAELSKLAGVEEDEAKRILDFTQSKANSHSAWLTFMYPRLYVARELLREDGVIFISIDDNEVAQLKLLCDEVFGEENFIDMITWQKTFAPKNDSKYFSSEHEYLLVYSKNKDILSLNLLPRTEKHNARYSNPDNDSRGVWISTDLLRMEHRDNSVYDIISPTGKVWTPKKGTSWRHPEQEMKILIDSGEVVFGKDGNAKPRRKRFLKDVKQGVVCQTIWKYDEVSHTQEAKQTLNKLFNNVPTFDTPKPIKLIERCLKLSTKKESFVLDFFAGSGTTAHAVMALNAEDGGNRKFITVQIDERTDEKSEANRVGYKSIFDITKARIEKASEQIDKNDGFKIFETTQMFEGYMDEIEDLEENTTLFNGKALTPDELESLLTTWRVYDGMKLTEPLVTVDLNGYNASYGANTLYLMHQSFNMEALQALIEKLDNDKNFEPSKVVMFGYNFESKNQRELGEGLKNYTNKKNIELEMVVRY